VSAGPGRLYLVPAPLDFGCAEQAPLSSVLPADVLLTVARLDCWICEDAKSTRAYLKRVEELTPLATPLRGQHIVELPRHVHKKGDHDGSFDARTWLAPALAGKDVGLVCEAGMPAIADPGSSVVRTAHTLGIETVALVGPVSLMLALAASGLGGQHFAFQGYLPQTPGERTVRIRELEALVRSSSQTQIFIETPYRNAALLASLVTTLQPATRLAVSWGLTLASGRHHSAAIVDWRRAMIAVPDLPAVFCIGR
jgi:16S rRNA (cytidine1402-2'-O)-methyltransferase